MFPLSQLHLRYKNVARGGEYELQKAGKQCGVGPLYTFNQRAVCSWERMIM